MREEPKELPPARTSQDASGLEVAFVRLRPDNKDFDLTFWTSVDEQRLETEVRRRLAQNGIRCGIIDSHMPEELTQLLQDESRASSRLTDMVSLSDNVSFQSRRLQCRTGHPHRLVSSSVHEDLVVLRRDQGEVRGEHYPSGQCQFTLRAFPHGEGSVEVELEPSIEYGAAQQRYVGQGGSFRLDTARQVKEFTDLRIRISLSPGQTLVVGSMEENIGIGKAFLGHSTADASDRKLLLIRLAHSQVDGLFSPQLLNRPIASTGSE